MKTENSRFFIYVIYLVIIFTINACNYQNQENGAVGKNKYAKISEYITNKIEASNTPSMSVGIAQDGIVVWEGSFGWASREKMVKATPQTIYSLASVSKPMTATAVMVLAEQGLIDLNDPINKYLNDSKIKIYEGDTKDATVSRLLHHTAGFPTIWNFYFDNAELSRPGINESIEKFGFIYTSPGTGFEYSNLGYGIAECIIENVSGKSYPEFMTSEIFEPLGMFNSFVLSDISQYNSIAPRYLENKNASPFYDVMSRGGGGICSNTHDLLLFGMFQLKNHLPYQKQIISDSTINLMQSDIDPMVETSNYKLGWDVRNIHGLNIISHGGGMPGVSSVLMLIPSENTVISILCNGTYIDLYDVGSQIIKYLLPEKDRQQKSKRESIKSNIPYEAFVGKWYGEITTDNGLIPIQMNISKDGRTEIKLIDNTKSFISKGLFDFNEDYLSGSFDLNINTKETSICRHKANIRLRLRNNTLRGYVAAESYRVEVFYLPFYIKLRKQPLSIK